MRICFSYDQTVKNIFANDRQNEFDGVGIILQKFNHRGN